MVTWNVIKRPVLVSLGNEHFSNNDLKVFSSVADVKANPHEVPPHILFSGSIQYMEHTFSVLDQKIDSGVIVLAFDRALFSPATSHQPFVQHPEPKRYYPVTYPAWSLSADLFDRHLVMKGFTLIEHFAAAPNSHFDHCGMNFARNLT